MRKRNKFFPAAQAAIKASAACLLIFSLAACPGDDDDNGNGNGVLESIGGAAGAGGKVWYLRRSEIALGVWPGTGTENPLSGTGAIWSFGDTGAGGVAPLHTRPCILDDAYTFEMVDASTLRFVVNTNDTLFLDTAANGGHSSIAEEGCEDEVVSADAPLWLIDRTITDEDRPMLPPSSRTDGMPDIYLYRNRSGDSDKGGFTYGLEGTQLTLTGRGHYLGLSSKDNTGDGGWRVPETRTFTVLVTDTDDVDTMTLEMASGGNVWIFNLVHYGGTTDLPPLPTAAPSIPSPCTGTNENVPLSNASPTIDFETSYPSIDVFGDAVSVCDLNPASGGINTSSQVLKIVKESAETFTGISFDLDGTLDIRGNCGFKVKAYGEAGTTLSFKVELGSDPTQSNEISTSVNPPAPSLAATNTWEEFSYDFSGIIPADRSNLFTELTFFPNLTLGVAGNTTIYIDDITVDTSIGACAGPPP